MERSRAVLDWAVGLETCNQLKGVVETTHVGLTVSAITTAMGMDIVANASKDSKGTPISLMDAKVIT
ncbi:hypothetical protein HHK36_011715 [Tetracentron sinense]|uniref:Uncharacterized protein n=1 Tax=Tetracentron sinense TaxID=13715 RepID=A0A834ZGW9_TETSI|nr:hypothetical protein HHK36_011715 [Tetracentron sinense]